MTLASTTRRAVAQPAKLVLRGAIRVRVRGWKPHSHLFAVGDRGGWSVDEDASHLEAAASRLGLPVGPARWARFCERQAVFLTSHFEALSPRWLESTHRLGTAYLHGRPGTPDAPEFDESYEMLRSHPERLARVQVTHTEMFELVVSAGVPEDRVFRIPIGIDLENFPFRSEADRFDARSALDIPAEAFVVGSFQKDGVGWGKGLEPKLVKGPDVLVAALRRLMKEVPELHVLLTGPSRGYVRKELDRSGIPYTHVLARSRAELARAYFALDVYVVASRQEGGPKSVLEAMASGVPLVSTRVGQTVDLVDHEVNGWLVEVANAERLAELAAHVHAGVDASLLSAARATAEAYALENLDDRWATLLEGFVEQPAA